MDDEAEKPFSKQIWARPETYKYLAVNTQFFIRILSSSHSTQQPHNHTLFTNPTLTLSTMFAQSIFVAAIAAVAVASPLAARTDYQCNTGPVQCCNQMKSHQSSEANIVASLLKLDLGAITGELSLQCSPIGSLVGGGAKWSVPLRKIVNILLMLFACFSSGQTVCCKDTKYSKLTSFPCEMG